MNAGAKPTDGGLAERRNIVALLPSTRDVMRCVPSSVLPLILYQRDDCPLCDQALAMLAAAGVPDFEPVWIDDDPALEARYGERVPVLRDQGSGQELDWPFDHVALRDLASATPE